MKAVSSIRRAAQIREIFWPILGRLDDVDGFFNREFERAEPMVREVCTYVLDSGGKRLRPLLMVISARLCCYTGGDTHKFSTIFEFLHAATLLHDDLIDGATIRRGRPVAHTVWDNSSAVLVGDFLLARSLTIAAETGRPRIIRVIVASALPVLFMAPMWQAP